MADKAGLTKQRRALTKLWLNARWPIILGVSVIVVAVAGTLGYQKFKEAEKAGHEAKARQVVSAISTQVAREVKKFEKSVREHFDQRVLATLVASGDETAIAAEQQRIVDASKLILAANLLPVGYDQLDSSVQPPIGYAVLDLLKRSERTGKASPPEVHAFQDEGRHIAWLIRLEDEADVLQGHLRLALAPGLLKRSVKGLRVEDGYAELVQPLSKSKPLVLAAIGDSSLRSPFSTTALGIPKTSWRVVFWTKSAEAAPGRGGSGQMLPIVGAVIAVLVLIGGFVAYKKRKAVAETDEQPAVPAAAGVGTPPVDELDPLDIGPPPLPEVQEEGEGMTVEEIPAPGASTASAPGSVSPVIFRAYDIRGVVTDDLSADTVRLIGKALGSEAYDRGQQTIVVGYDGRLSGPELAEALTEGLRSSGRDVIEIGRVPTPVLYFATHYLNTGSGIMVTGSHNPPEYNGLKIMLGGETLFGDAIQSLRERIEAGNFQTGDGSHQTMDVLPEYIRRVTDDVPVALGNAFKVVVDCGNGVAGDVAPKLIRALGHDVIELFCEVDGNFPNHHPDPSKPENLQDLISAIQENDADIGFAFDGDGDRLGVVDANGKVLWPDLQMMLYARDILSRNPGAQIIYDVKCTNRLGKVIKKLGGDPLMWKTGHSFIKNKMRETGALLAGEMSGHFFFKERWYGFDDAMYASARMLELLLGFKQPPAEVFAKLPTGVATPELNLKMAEGEHHVFMDRFVESAVFSAGEKSTIDGLRIDYSDGWGLVRASNTTPCLVLRFEANDQAALERIQDEFRAALLSLDPDLQLPF